MFGIKEYLFNVFCPHEEKSLYAMAECLKRNGFKIVDLRETELLNENNEVVQRIYILKCRATTKTKYNIFKEKNKMNEIMYEGLLTLIG